ncbi:MAG: NUDIX hydrolase [Candidatus Magasanikbacteria bacterium]|jgi:8-oxo-dGTP diphosphatase|nr:NUDIX hydrolase [Candidatus Magasanikbacteria bacterium]
MAIYTDVYNNPHEKPENTPIVWRPSAYTLIVEDGKLLMIQPSWHKQWELPGGGVEKEELLHEGGVRETLEETGYTVTIDNIEPFFVESCRFYIDLITKNTFCNSIKAFYLATRTDDAQQELHQNPHGINETEQMKWIPLTELTDKIVLHAHWPAVKKLLEKK